MYFLCINVNNELSLAKNIKGVIKNILSMFGNLFFINNQKLKLFLLIYFLFIPRCLIYFFHFLFLILNNVVNFNNNVFFIIFAFKIK